ncbi:hypothetical protein WJX72_003568 [[Myrmecia] bisecta]|uniref:FAD/NAD(P)-binding domain-containing protein n=1 Tax=[Myrmecia] bisecta TaxID=41462 RepID=A0AAW1P5S1_9CHLO
MTDAYERRLRPVYDAIDIGSWKAAIKHANTALAKYKNDQLLRCLKALALQRNGRPDEALQACEEVRRATPDDERVLFTLGLVYRRLGCLQQLTATHVAASAARPADVDLLAGVFYAHVREFNYVKQQQVAMQLHRLAGQHKPSFAWWAIASLVLQARAALAGGASASMAPQQLLQLAHTMVTKQLEKAGRFLNYEALLLYIDILKAQGQTGEALKVVQGDLGGVVPLPEERHALAAALMAEMGERQAAADMYKQALMQDPDDWASLQAALDCVLPPAPSGAPRTWDSSAPAVVGGLADVTQRLSSLDVHERTASQVDESFSKGLEQAEALLAEGILQYFGKLGHMASCAVDVRAYTRAVSGNRRPWLAQQLHAVCDESEVACEQLEPSHLLREVRRRICAYQLEHDLGLPDFATAGEAEAHALRLVALHRSALPLTANLDEKERGPADEALALAANSLLRAIALEQPAGNATVLRRILQAVLVVEAGQQRRSVSSPLRLAATALYTLLGAAAPADSNFRMLDIKHIMHDTMTGHQILPVVMSSLWEARAQSLLRAVEALHNDHIRDAGDTLIMAYRQDTFSKVVEFVDFKERLERSHTRALAGSELALMHLRRAALGSLAAAHQAAEEAAFMIGQLPDVGDAGVAAAMRFNEDLSTRPAWLPPLAASPGLQVAAWWATAAHMQWPGYAQCWWSCTSAAETPRPEAQAYREALQKALQRRWLLPRMLTSLLAPAAPQQKDVSESSRDLAGYVNRLAAACSVPDVATALQTASGKNGMLQQLPLSDVCQLVNLATFQAAVPFQVILDELSHPTAEHLQELRSACTSLQHVFTGACDRIAASLSPLHSLHGLVDGGTLAAAAWLVGEEAAWLGLGLRLWHDRLQPTTGKRKKGKKASENGASPTSNGLNGLAVAQQALAAVQEAYHSGLQSVGSALASLLQQRDQVALLRKAVEAGGEMQLDVLAGADSTTEQEAAMGLPKLVIVGGGHAGVALAQALHGAADVTLVDRKDFYSINWANVRVAVMPELSDQVNIPYKDIPRLDNVVQASVTHVTPTSVTLDNGNTLAFDYLVIATGSAYSDPMGKSPETTAVGALFDNQTRAKALRDAQTVLIVGGGPTAVELAGEIVTELPDKQVTMVQSAATLLPSVRPALGQNAHVWLSKKGVKLIMNERVARDATGSLITDKGKERLSADVVYWCTGNTPQTAFLKSTMPHALDDRGLIKVDEHLRVEGATNMFAIGDCTNIPETKLGFLAKTQAGVLAKNLKTMLAAGPSKAQLKTYKAGGGMPQVMLVTLGRGYGVGQNNFASYHLLAEVTSACGQL